MAQRIAHHTLNLEVAGSSPVWSAVRYAVYGNFISAGSSNYLNIKLVLMVHYICSDCEMVYASDYYSGGFDVIVPYKYIPHLKMNPIVFFRLSIVWTNST